MTRNKRVVNVDKAKLSDAEENRPVSKTGYIVELNDYRSNNKKSTIL